MRLNTASLATLEREEHGFPSVEVEAPSPLEVPFCVATDRVPRASEVRPAATQALLLDREPGC